MARSHRTLWLAAVALGAVACTGLPLPFTAAQLEEASARLPPGKVLVHFLGQANADPSVCDLHGRAGHLARVDERAMRDLVDALVDGKVAPPVFQRCAALLWLDAPEPVARSLVSAAAEAIADQIRGADYDDAVANEVEALHRFFAEQPPGNGLPLPVSAVLVRLVERLNTAREKGRLGPRARELAAAIVETVEMDLGRLRGEPVTEAGILAMSDEALLRRLAARLPFATLREVARRRIVRLRIKASSFPEVRERADQVERTVMEQGRNPIAPQGSALRRSWAEASAASYGVLVRQDLLRQRTSLLSYRGGEPGQSVLPTLDLKGLLMFDVAGISWPITLCGPAVTLAVEPCLDARALEVGNPVAQVDEDGVVHFVDGVPLATAVELLDAGRGFALRPTYEARALPALELPLWFEKPADLILQANGGQRGADLHIVAAARPGRLVLTTRPEGAARELLAVVELQDAAGFHVVSRGGLGATGSTGYRGADGTPGMAGSPGMCPSTPGGAGGNGGAGGRGGDGGPGGKGGDGGDVDVELRCDGEDCPQLARLLKSVVRSEGGAGGHGGSGGAGGNGGAGGAGGSGASCYSNGQYTSVSSGPAGSPGMSGSPGSTGATGAPGAAGQVRVRVTKS